MNTHIHSLRSVQTACRMAQLLAALSVLAPLGQIAHAADKLARQDVEQNQAPVASQPRLRLRVAVDQFKWNEIRSETPLPRDLREGLQALLIDKLRTCGGFQVMDREATVIQMDRIEDRIDQEKRAGQGAGTTGLPVRQRRTPARYIITPTVTAFQETGGGNSMFTVPIFGRIGGRDKTATMSINIRISDAETSAIIESATATGTIKSKASLFDGRVLGIPITNEKFQTSPIGKVVEATLKDAVAIIVKRLSNEPWSAMVAGQDAGTGRVILNVGTDAGLETGMEFDVLHSSGDTFNPETGDLLTHGDEVKTGRLRVVRVERDVAFCNVLEGKTFAPKDVVRFVK